MLGDLHRNHRQLDDFPSALKPAAGQVGAAIGTVLNHVLHPVGGYHARAGEAVASLLLGLLLRWGLPARFRLEGGYTERAARFYLALQFGNLLLQLLNHRLKLGDDDNENNAVDGGQVNFSTHALYMI